MRTTRLAFILVFGSFSALGPLACGDDQFQGSGNSAGQSTSESGSTNGPDSDPDTGDAGSDSVGGNGNGPGSGTGGQPADVGCQLDDDCPAATSECSSRACVDGECVDAALAEGTACAEGACNADGVCVESGCESGEQDGDETGPDCGGSCAALCENGEGCASGSDCLSGVCTNQECQPSDCTDGVLNGTETDLDCGGGCAKLCEPGAACQEAKDCAVSAGAGPESVRCLDSVCTKTKPPGEGLRYWQDFEPARLKKAVEDATACSAEDEMCLYGSGAAYQMLGVNTAGAPTPLTAAKLFTAQGAVGSGGKFDGTYCLKRGGSNMSMADLGELTSMAWVKSTRSKTPWEGAIIGARDHHLIAVDSNPVASRFLAAVYTTGSMSFKYRYSANTDEVVTGEWHHVAATYSAATGFIQYVDGVEVKATEIIGTINAAKEDVYMGCRMASQLEQFFIGTLDEVALYTRALSADEISDYVRRSQPAE